MNRLHFLGLRLVRTLATLVIIVFITFAIFSLWPSDPATLACGRPCTPENLERARAFMGYDLPWYTQFWHYLQGIVGGRTFGEGSGAIACASPCLGYSFRLSTPVSELVATRLPVTASIAVGAAVLWLAIGVGAGVVSALRRGSRLDRTIMTGTVLGISSPAYLVGLLGILLFGFTLDMVPVSGYVPFADSPLDWAWHLILPWCVLALISAAVYARMVRGEMLENLGEDYVRTARAVGLPERRVVGRHVMRNISLPVVTYFALDLGGLLGGAVITERVFSMQGLGALLMVGTPTGDPPRADRSTGRTPMSHPHRTLIASRRAFLAGTGMTALTALTLAACGANSRSSSGASASAKAGGNLTILTSATDVGWDPAKSQSMPMTSLGLVHRRLTTWKLAPGKPVELAADLATDTGKASDDGRTWTFTLKKGLKFSDGSAITSAHIKHGVERSFAPALSGGLGYHKSLLAGAEGYQGPYSGAHLSSIETPDESTIVFHLARAFGDWPWIVAQPAFSPVPEGDDPATYSHAPIASGPYQIDQYKQGSSITLKRNPHWSKDTDSIRLALPDTFTFSLGQDETTSAQRLIADSGEDRNAFGADRVSAAQLAQVSANESAKSRLATSPEGGPLAFLAINVQRVSDVNVRKAIAHAVDKAAVVAALGGELGAQAASTYITPGIPGRQNYDLYPHDAAKAKELLTGKTVPALVLLTDNGAASKAMAEAVGQSLKEVGLKVTIEPVEPDTFTERATKGDGSTYDLAIANWNPDYPSANANIQPLFASSEIGSGGSNYARYSNAEVDAAIAQAQANLEAKAAQAQWAALDRKIAEEVPVVPLAYRRNSFLHGSGVAGFFVESYPAYPSYQVIGVSAS